MNEVTLVFKPWVPEWMLRLTLYIVILPSIVLFALSVANVNAAAGYYGIEPNDVQYSLIILYAAMASFFVLEGRFFKNIAGKQYLLIGMMLQMGTSYVCYVTRQVSILYVMRFLQGMTTCGCISISLNLIFSRLHSERAREIGYSILYSTLLCIIPLTTLITASIIDTFDFNTVYKCAVFSYVPGALLIFCIMNNVRFTRKVPLYKLEWTSFVLYATTLCLIGYVMVYGQQYNWLEDGRILLSLAVILAMLCTMLLRQAFLKRPYLQLQVLKSRNFKIAAMLLFVFYICKGSLGVTTSYFATVLGMDPIHIGYLMLWNIAGIVVAALISSRMMLQKVHTRIILLCGFILLGAFHVQMCFLFQVQVGANQFIVPLLLQGLGSGMLMVPIILFMVSSVPLQLGTTASGIGIFTRFMGFCTSMALVNFFQLFGQSTHYNRFQESLSVLDPAVVQRLGTYKQAMVSKGVGAEQAGNIANGLLFKSVGVQAQLRYAMDYYQILSWVILEVILLIALFPSINRTIINVRTNQPTPVAY